VVFTKTITTGANTAITSPKESWIGISRGLVYRSQVMFPPGCCGLAGVKIFEGGHQIYPVSPDEWLVGAGETIDFEDLYMITVLNTDLRILTYNLDTAYDHNIYVRLGVVVRPEFIARFLPTVGYEELEKLIEAIAREKQEAEVSAAFALAEQLPKEGD